MSYGLIMFLVFLGSLGGAYIGIEIYKMVNQFGTLVVDETDPNKDVFRIELDMDLNKVKKKDYIVLKVDRRFKKNVLDITKVQEE